MQTPPALVLVAVRIRSGLRQRSVACIRQYGDGGGVPLGGHVVACRALLCCRGGETWAAGGEVAGIECYVAVCGGGIGGCRHRVGGAVPHIFSVQYILGVR